MTWTCSLFHYCALVQKSNVTVPVNVPTTNSTTPTSSYLTLSEFNSIQQVCFYSVSLSFFYSFCLAMQLKWNADSPIRKSPDALTSDSFLVVLLGCVLYTITLAIDHLNLSYLIAYLVLTLIFRIGSWFTLIRFAQRSMMRIRRMMEMTKNLTAFQSPSGNPIYCWSWVLHAFLFFVLATELILVIYMVLISPTQDVYIQGYVMLVFFWYSLFIFTLLHFTWIHKRIVQKTGVFWGSADIPEATRSEARGRIRQQMRVFYRLLCALSLGWMVQVSLSVLVWIIPLSEYPILIILDCFRQGFLFGLSWCVPYRTLIHKQLLRSAPKTENKNMDDSTPSDRTDRRPDVLTRVTEPPTEPPHVLTI